MHRLGNKINGILNAGQTSVLFLTKAKMEGPDTSRHPVSENTGAGQVLPQVRPQQVVFKT